MAKQQPQNDAESLKRSHSKSSNAKLTFLCLMSSIVLTALWVSVGLLERIGNNAVMIPVIVVLAVMFSFDVMLFSKFTR